jgi:hypothetical protein
MIAARQVAFGKAAGKGLSAKDYIQDGLVAMWDGIENAGWGVHDSAATVWKDLVGDHDATINGGIWGSNCWNCGNNNATFDGTLFGGDFSVEFVFFGDASESQQYATTLTNKKDSYSWFRRDGAYWEAKILGGNSYRSPLAPFIEKPFYHIHRDSEFDRIGYHDASSITERETNYNATAADTTWQIGGNQTRYLGDSARYYALRIYNRALTAEEIAHNYEIDRVRFNLP